MGYTIDIDTGGTFTDGFFVRDGRVETVKVPTTPHDLTICFLKCIEAGADRFEVAVDDLLYETEIIRFSNTIGTNTIIQRDGTKIGLLVTSDRGSLAPTDSKEGKAPLVMPDMVLGLEEAVSPDGKVVKPPDEQAALTAAQRLIDRGARCLVVALANSEFNPANERLVRQVLKREYPSDFLGSVPVFLSSDISRRSGEAERINAAVLNAYIHAKLVRLLYKAGEELRKRLYRKNLFIVHNNSAVARVARTRAINTYNSGPAAGLLGARLIGELYGESDLISADMGGTSFDLGYVSQGQPSYTLQPDVEGFPVNVPMLAIRAIGAGGGSIASVKEGELQVGPQSAGALPGPVCFDLGGSEPTVADADVVLGILDPDYFLGGTMNLNRDKARGVMEARIAGPLGISVEQAALEIKKKVDEAMGAEVKKIKEKIGSNMEPLLVFYGGAGPAHCCDIARVAGLKKIIITPFS
ncbi:MAG: hydantoinase/oxoprolinase family protein, partial [Deltaproteobacteria bacterium]|nr:hydantoinase/oxoprolinase family protein [Deltaproteobacteria bacterium]